MLKLIQKINNSIFDEKNTIKNPKNTLRKIQFFLMYRSNICNSKAIQQINN